MILKPIQHKSKIYIYIRYSNGKTQFIEPYTYSRVKANMSIKDKKSHLAMYKYADGTLVNFDILHKGGSK